MKINFTGNGMAITPALQQFTQEKFNKLERHFDKIISVSVTFMVEKRMQIAEANVIVHKSELHAQAESENMYTAIDSLVEKLDKQLIKYKEKTQGHRE